MQFDHSSRVREFYHGNSDVTLKCVWTLRAYVHSWHCLGMPLMTQLMVGLGGSPPRARSGHESAPRKSVVVLGGIRCTIHSVPQVLKSFFISFCFFYVIMDECAVCLKLHVFFIHLWSFCMVLHSVLVSLGLFSISSSFGKKVDTCIFYN